ncbi:MAG TPA: TonB-dependent receptor [Candidatus Acidoferrales bacterium]|nr:TonB-dependent receptor [Candidatus Acidoferrales bacterium]
MNARTLVLAAVFAGAPWAQSYLGGIRGSVLDASGKSVGETKITMIDEAGGTQRSTLSNGEGSYSFSQVVPATYTLTAEAPGFKKFERKHVIVGTQEIVALDLKMEVGSVSESVQVTEEVSLIEAANASQGQVLDRQQLIDLPNLGRNPFMMSKLAQNVTPVGDPHYNRMEDQSGSSQISIAGGPVRGNNYLLDGIPITDAANRAIIIPTLEAVQEVKVQSNTYDAEMARTGGGMFNTYLKSGANEFHGSLFGSMRATNWAANNFFNNAAGIPLPDQPNYTYGASFGGRVKIPKVYDGKNRTFFWLAWEGYSDTQSNSSQFTTPTALERVGNFSQSKITIYDPQTTVCAGSTCTRTPFAGNIIPGGRLDKVGLNIAATYVQPQTVSASYGAPNLTAAAKLPARASQKTAKLDHQVTNWWRASLSYLRYFSLEPGNTWFPTVSSPDQWRLLRNVDTTQLNNILTISPTTVLTVRYGFNRFPNYGYQVSQGYNLANLGFDPGYIAQIPSPTFPNVTMTSQYSLGTNNNFYYVHHSKNLSAQIAKYMGRHNLKAGFDYRRIHDDGNDFANSAGAFTFNGVFTRSTPLTAVSGTGADLADMLLGAPSAGTGYIPTKLYEFADYYGIYFQDDIRVTKSLTVNVGLRWEREYGLQESHNQMVVGFNTQAVNPLAAGVTGIVPKGVIQFAGVNGNSIHVSNPNLNKMGPRIGLAWQMDSKTTIRGGYGLYWAPQFAIGTPYNPPGYTATSTYVASNDGNSTPANSLTNPFPTGLAKPTGNSLGDLSGIGQSLSIIDPNARSPRVHQYSIDVQRQLPFGIAIEVGYVGSHSTHLTQATANININALYPALITPALISSASSSVPNPFYGKGGAGVIAGATVSPIQLALPFPTFSTINYQFNDSSHARYDSLVAKAQKRLSMGFTFLSTLTWSRNHDASSGGAGNFLNGGNAGPQNPYDMASEYSLANVDSPLRWSTGFTYELPFGKGKKMLGTSKALDYLVGGWNVNALSVYQSGFPVQITQATNNNSVFGYASQRPGATGTSPVTSGTLEERLGNYINPAAFSTAPRGAFGNIARTLDMRGPGQANWDLSVFKTISVTEKFKGQFRAEALNAFNTPMFAAPNTSFGSGSFGKITSQVNFSRMIQLGIRLYF